MGLELQKEVFIHKVQESKCNFTRLQTLTKERKLSTAPWTLREVFLPCEKWRGDVVFIANPTFK